MVLNRTTYKNHRVCWYPLNQGYGAQSNECPCVACKYYLINLRFKRVLFRACFDYLINL